jgi:hypothetical protein
MNRHLSTLSVLYYIYGVLVCLGGAAILVVVAMGMFMFMQSDLVANGQDAPPAWVGGFMQVLGWVLFAFIELLGILYISSGRWISQRRRRTGSMVMAALACLSFPFGTALGIFTFVVLLDKDVQAEYEAKPTAA